MHPISGIWIALSLTLLATTSSFAASKKSGPEKIVQQAAAKENAGDYEGAAALYESVLKYHPDFGPALLGLAQVQYWQGHYENSIKTYEKFLGYNPDSVEAQVGIGKAYLALGKSKKADDYFARAKKRDPGNKEVESAEPLLGSDTHIRFMGGYIAEELSYATDAAGEYQEIRITKEKKFGFGLYNAYLNRFGRQAFNTKLFGHYYFLENTRADLGVSFAPNAVIVPRQSYTVGMAHHISKFTPELHYTFEDFTRANTHTLEAALFVEPAEWLRIGGGYEFQSLMIGTTSQNFHGGFGKIKFTPTQWLTVDGFLGSHRRGFEAGRNPSPFVNYRALTGGGGIRFDFVTSFSLGFEVSVEDRDNNETAATYILSVGYLF